MANDSQATDYQSQAADQQAQDNALAGNQQAVRQQSQSQQYNYSDNSAQNQQAGQPVYAPGTTDNSARTYPKILADHPELSDEVLTLLERKRQNRLSDRQAENSPELMAYYDFVSKIDPTSATFNPPPTDSIPMPVGGLDTIVRHHLGTRPVFDRPAQDYTPQEMGDILKAQHEYDSQATLYRQLLFTLNKDTLRTENRYVRNAHVRVFSEFA